MTNLKRVFLVMLVVILLGATIVFATNNDTIYITDNTIVEPSNTIVEPSNTTIPVNDTNTSTYNNTTESLPQTGADDYLMISIIAVFAVFAVYAYKKVSDYKNI